MSIIDHIIVVVQKDGNDLLSHSHSLSSLLFNVIMTQMCKYKLTTHILLLLSPAVTMV